MRTTIRLNAGLMRQTKRWAMEQHKTFTSVVEDALSAWLHADRKKSPSRGKISIPTGGSGGLLPGVDLDSNASLFDKMDGLR